MSKIILLSALIAVASSKEFGSPQHNTNGVCIFNNKNYNPGQEWYTSDCKKWKCVKGSSENEMILEGESCDYNKAKGRSCEAKTIPGKKYPECCTSEVVCGGDRPNHGNVRVERAAGGHNDTDWTKVDQGWKELDRKRAESWQKYGESWKGQSTTPKGRVARAAGGGYDPYWAKVDQGWKELDRQRAESWQKYGQSWSGQPTNNPVRVTRAAGGGYDPYWAKVDQGWKELDRARDQYWATYHQSWSDGDRNRDRIRDDRDRIRDDRDRIRDNRDRYRS